MFKNQYQGGPFVEIFSAQGKNPGAKWKILGNPSAIRKEYDKEVKGFVFVLEGSSQINKMQLPKKTRQTLGLVQQFLTLQIFVPLGQDFSTELLITDLGNIKRRLYLSTVYKELSVTPLHAKIPLFMIKRKIWCNMCIDLVAFTSEIFRGAVFQSLDGITVSANCKLRKIFTLKSKPQDTAEEDDMHVVPFMPYEPAAVIPQTCQLHTDVPQVTQLLNLTKVQKPEIKSRRYPEGVKETGDFTYDLDKLKKRNIDIACRSATPGDNTDILDERPHGNTHSSRTRDVSHIAFGSKILGPPPSSNRRVSTKASGEVKKTWSSRSSRSCQLQSSGKGIISVPDTERLDLSLSPCNDSLDQGGKRNTCQATEDMCQNDPAIQTQKTSESEGADFQLISPQGPSAEKNSHRLSPNNAGKSTWEIISDEWVFPESFTEKTQMDRSEQFVAIEDSTCHSLTSPQNASVEHYSNETDAHQVDSKEIFTFSSRPRSAPHGKSPNTSPEYSIFPLELNQDINGVPGKTQAEDNFEGADSSEKDDNNGFIQGTENFEICHNREGTSESAVSGEIPLKSRSWRDEYWKNKGDRKQNLEENQILPKPQSSTERTRDSASSQRSLKPTLSCSPTGSKSEFFKVIPDGSEKTERYQGVSGQLKRSITKKSLKKISRENTCLTTQAQEYEWESYQSNRLSSSELQMLASMKRQQNEELRDTEISHGLSASQIDNCNVSISTSSDDTATWNSCFPPPISQEHHYQKEMSPLSHSNPRDWLNVFSPPINPGSKQLEEHTESSANQSVPGEDDLSAEEDEEFLTLLYDPCLNCYFDPNSGKYYELA